MMCEIFLVEKIHIVVHPEDGGSVWYSVGVITWKTTSSWYWWQDNSPWCCEASAKLHFIKNSYSGSS
jgi:hypothetical protein